MPVLYGVFLYMGVSSLHGIQVLCGSATDMSLTLRSLVLTREAQPVPEKLVPSLAICARNVFQI